MKEMYQRILPLILFFMVCMGKVVGNGRVKEPDRIISLSPSITEMIYALGAGDRLVGNTRFCQYPSEAQYVTKVGGLLDPNWEKMLGLKPDLVLLPSLSHQGFLARLEELKLPVVVLHREEGLDGLLKDIKFLGEVLGCSQRALELIEEIEASIEEVKRQVFEQRERGVPPVRVLLLYGSVAAGKGSFAGELLSLAGAENIAVGAKWPTLSVEYVLQADPEVILIAKETGNNFLCVEENALDNYRRDPVWREISAVRRGAVYRLDGKLMGIPGPRVGLALTHLWQAISMGWKTGFEPATP